MGAKLTFPKVAIPKGRTYVVTGGNGGIGYETTKYIAAHGGRLIIACRSEQKAVAAIEQMQKEHRDRDNSPNTSDEGALPPTDKLDIEYMQLDLSSLASTMEFIEAYKSKGYPLDVLICNAGIAYAQYGETQDGFEQMFQVNYLSHHLIVLHLLPLLKQSAPNSRIVLVSSLAHRGGSFDLDNIQGKRSYSRIYFYNHSKLFQVMSMYSLARRLRDSGIGVFTLHPGVVETGIIHNLSDSKVLVPMVHGFMKLFRIYRNPLEGAATTLVAALDPVYDSETALYFDSCKPTEPIDASKDIEKQEALWKYSIDCLKNYITENQITNIFSSLRHDDDDTPPTDETKNHAETTVEDAAVTDSDIPPSSEKDVDVSGGGLSLEEDQVEQTEEDTVLEPKSDEEESPQRGEDDDDDAKPDDQNQGSHDGKCAEPQEAPLDVIVPLETQSTSDEANTNQQTSH